MKIIEFEVKEGLAFLYDIKRFLYSLEHGDYEIIFHRPLLKIWRSRLTEDEFSSVLSVIKKCQNDRIKITEKNAVLNKISVSILEGDETTKKWQAGVIYSGNINETEEINSCLSALIKVPELNYRGSILVCGPSSGSKKFERITQVTYLPYDVEEISFNISKKKNYLISQMSSDVCIVLHARIIVEDNLISNLPSFFDLITPAVFIKSKSNNLIPYLDLCFKRAIHPNIHYDNPVPLFYNRKNAYVKMKKYAPYIDGGIMIFPKNLWAAHKFNEQLHWNESEDVEWSARLLVNCLIVDVAPNSRVLSSKHKTLRYWKYGDGFFYRFLSVVRRMAK
jgi:hypothetical protein